MNKIFLIGRLTKDPELKYTQSGTAVCNFTLAVDRHFTSQNGEKEADFINTVVWNKAAENCAKYLTKGRQTAVEGRLQIRSYDGKDGQKRWVTEVVAENVEFLSSGQNQSKNGGQPQTSTHGDSDYGDLGQEIVFSDDDIPF